jgi:uncharacterized protein
MTEPEEPKPESPAAKIAAAEAAPAKPSRATFDPRVVEMLVCPLTRTSLDYDATRQELISRAARLAFPIRDGVPHLTREAARELES